MKIDVVTIFPAYLDPLRQSLPGRAIASGLVDLQVHDLRRWTYDVHHSVDDSPYGGGPGMVMKAPVWGKRSTKYVRLKRFWLSRRPPARCLTRPPRNGGVPSSTWCSPAAGMRG